MSNSASSTPESDPVVAHRQAVTTKIQFCVLTISDTRTPENDKSGTAIKELMHESGHELVAYKILKDEPDLIGEEFTSVCNHCDVVLTTGGTGLALRDCTPQAIIPLLDIELQGFGELFRMLSFEEIGTAAMLSRAFAGRRGRTLCFALPGSSNAVKMAMTKIIIPELPHAIGLIKRS